VTSTTPLQTCPQCSFVLPSPRPTLCPSCHYPLVFVEDSPTPDGATELERPTPDPEPVEPEPDVGPPADPLPPAVTVACPHCGYGNAPDRLWCERCGKSTVPEQPPPPPPPPPPPTATGLASVPTWVWIVTGAVVVALSVAGYLVVRSRETAEPEPTPSVTTTSAEPATPTPTPTPESTPLKVSKATATSTHPKATNESYGAGKTIDDNPKTAWNSYGSKVGAKAKGVELTWTLDESAHLTAIEIHNGFQTSERRFKANGRIKAVEIVTEDGAEEFTLEDTMGKQTIEHDFGVTDYVRFTVLSVYRDKTTKFKDLALSEVAFLGFPDQ